MKSLSSSGLSGTASHFTPESTNLSKPYPNLLPVDESQTVIFGNPLGNVAVLDLKRIVETLPPAPTPEARQKKLDQIRQAASAVATARNFSYVFDKSAITPLNTPVILFDSGTPDLTESVLQKFKR